MPEEVKPPDPPKLPPVEQTGLIAYDDFAKADLRTAEIVAAEPHPNADRLMVLQLKVGEKTKQIVAGIRQHYTPESLVGKTIIIVDNLQPTKLRGVESNGMLLAVKTPELGVLRLLTIDGPAQSGLKVS